MSLSTIRADAGTIFKETLSATAPKELTNRTPIARQAGKVLLACDHCGLQFWRKSSHAGGRNYCGMGCSQAAQRRRVSCNCSICGDPFLIWPCAAEKGRTTCGKPECVSARQRIVAGSRARDEHNAFTRPEGTATIERRKASD